MFLDGSLSVTGNVRDFVKPRVSLVAALKLGPPTVAHALYVQRVGELQ
jgi:hypothetical protein